MSKKIAKKDIQNHSTPHHFNNAAKQDQRVEISTQQIDLGHLKIGVKDYEIKYWHKKSNTIGKFKYY